MSLHQVAMTEKSKMEGKLALLRNISSGLGDQVRESASGQGSLEVYSYPVALVLLAQRV